MSKISLTPNASGTGNFTIASPATNTDRTLTLPDATGTINTSGAVNEVPAGTASAPSIYPTGDTNTGIFFPAADTIAFAEGGAEVMRINASGNVGIGTSSPSSDAIVKFINISDATSSGIVLTAPRKFSIYSSGSATLVFRDETAAATRVSLDSSGYITNGANGNSAGLVQGSQYYRLNSGYAGSNATGAQSIFGVGVTLVGSTVYEFEIMFIIARTAGTTAHNISVGFGGTATLNNILYVANGNNNSSLNVENTAPRFGAYNTANSSVITAGSLSSTGSGQILIKGTVSVNAGGTFIPQYTLSAAPGGAYTTQIGSYIKIAPISASGANTNVGSWA